MPVRRHLSIWGIILLAGLLFAAETARESSFSMAAGAIPIRIRAAANSILSGQFGSEEAMALGTLVSSIFLHGDPQHILYNMVFLWTFGILTSDLLGQWRTLAIFLVTGICGGILHVALNPTSSAPMIGASGAISGLEGAYLGLALRWQLPDVEVWPLAYPIPSMHLGFFALIGFMGDLILFANHEKHVAFGAHLGGFLSGLLIAAILTTIYPTAYQYERATRKDCI
ncbi:MAG: rhomboid family intramembrane serine protease [Pirellulales bacterium]